MARRGIRLSTLAIWWVRWISTLAIIWVILIRCLAIWRIRRVYSLGIRRIWWWRVGWIGSLAILRIRGICILSITSSRRRILGCSSSGGSCWILIIRLRMS